MVFSFPAPQDIKSLTRHRDVSSLNPWLLEAALENAQSIKVAKGKTGMSSQHSIWDIVFIQVQYKTITMITIKHQTAFQTTTMFQAHGK